MADQPKGTTDPASGEEMMRVLENMTSRLYGKCHFIGIVVDVNGMSLIYPARTNHIALLEDALEAALTIKPERQQKIKLDKPQ